MVDTMEMPYEYDLQDDAELPQPSKVATYVQNDIAARAQMGLGYSHDALWDLYQNTLGLAMYLRKLILERDGQM